MTSASKESGSNVSVVLRYGTQTIVPFHTFSVQKPVTEPAGMTDHSVILQEDRAMQTRSLLPCRDSIQSETMRGGNVYTNVNTNWFKLITIRYANQQEDY